MGRWFGKGKMIHSCESTPPAARSPLASEGHVPGHTFTYVAVFPFHPASQFDKYFLDQVGFCPSLARGDRAAGGVDQTYAIIKQ